MRGVSKTELCTDQPAKKQGATSEFCCAASLLLDRPLPDYPNLQRSLRMEDVLRTGSPEAHMKECKEDLDIKRCCLKSRQSVLLLSENACLCGA